MSTTSTPTPVDEYARLFTEPAAWADMDAWHDKAGELRRTQPVLRIEQEGFDPYWVLTRHADIFAVERDSDLWLNTSQSILMPREQWEGMLAQGLPEPATLVHLDGQKHRDHRAIATPMFKANAVAKRQERIDELADLYIEKMRELGGSCDFAKDIAQPYTLRVIMEIYGVPEEDEAMMLSLTQGLFGAADPEFMGDAENPLESALGSVMQFVQYFNDITADRQACPRDDLASVIANAEIDGCPIGDLERLWYYIIVATAGHDTTSFALAGGMEALLRNPDQLALLHQDPSLAANAAEEIIRWTSPVRHFLRYATRDTEVHGVPIPAGDRVLLSYPAANRDEEVFVDADRFDINRPDADKLISFGVGAHFCLGAHFARREVRTMLSKLLPQLERIELAGPARWAESTFVSGVKHLPVTYRFR